MRVLIIDNYDSFTYNLFQYVGELLSEKFSSSEFDITVKRNNEIDLNRVREYNPDRIIISPGPGTPSDEAYFGICAKVITEIGKTTPLLGVCLGMQGIAHCFGGNIIRADLPMHGKTSLIQHDERGVYCKVPQLLEIMRYHSLMVEQQTLPACFDITSVIAGESVCNAPLTTLAKDGAEIMGIRHKQYPIEGIQYHPESFGTEGGKNLLANFLFQQ